MAPVFPIDRALKITPNMSGLIAEFGPGGSIGSVGTVILDFVPDGSWNGSLVVMGRAAGVEASNADIPLVPVPYRALYLNNAIPAVPYGFDTQQITARSIVQVPANTTVAVMAACTAGFGWLYSRPLDGPSAP